MKLVFLAIALLFGHGAGAQVTNAVLKSGVPATSTSVFVDHKSTSKVIVVLGNGTGFTSVDGGAHWDEWAGAVDDGHALSTLVTDVKGALYGVYGEKQQELTVPATRWAEVAGGKWSEWGYPSLTETADNFDFQLNSGLKKEELLLSWTAWIHPGQPDCSSVVYFSKSDSRGRKWSKPVRVNATEGKCVLDGGAVLPAAPVMASDGKLFTCWTGGGSIYLDRSYDEGQMWLSGDLTIGKIRGGNEGYEIPDAGKFNHRVAFGIDNSTGPFQKSLYIAWADQRNTNTDIWMTRSSNRGDNWSQPLKMNQDTTLRHQYLPGIALDPVNGALYAAWYDRRESANEDTHVYLAWSLDGGNHFTEIRVSEQAFRHLKGNDHPVSIQALKGVIAVSWLGEVAGEARAFAAVVQADALKTNPTK